MTILGSVETADFVRFCPMCGSSALDIQGGVLEGTTQSALCRGCGWSGSQRQLLLVPFKHGFSDDDHMIRELMSDLRASASSRFAPELVQILLKWGFLKKPVTREQLSRYLTRILHAMTVAVLEERNNEESHNAKRTTTPS